MPDDPIPYAELGRLGPFFELTRGGGGTPVAGLVTDQVLTDAAIADYLARLHTDRRDIAGSLLVQGWAGRVLSVYAGCAVLLDAVPDLAAGNMTYALVPGRPVRLALAVPGLLGPTAGWDRLARDHLNPLIEMVDRRSRAGHRRLWGNVAAAMAGALGGLARAGLAGLDELTARPWAQPPELADLGGWVPTPSGPVFARRTCCNLVRIPGYDLCADCVIAWPPRWPRPCPGNSGG